MVSCPPAPPPPTHTHTLPCSEFLCVCTLPACVLVRVYLCGCDPLLSPTECVHAELGKRCHTACVCRNGITNGTGKCDAYIAVLCASAGLGVHTLAQIDVQRWGCYALWALTYISPEQSPNVQHRYPAHPPLVHSLSLHSSPPPLFLVVTLVCGSAGYNARSRRTQRLRICTSMLTSRSAQS